MSPHSRPALALLARASLACILAAACESDPGSPVDGTVRTLDVVPATAWLVPGSSLSLDATARDSAGGVTNATVRWSTSNASVAGVSSSGVVAAGSTGTATITAEAGGVRTTSTITVTGATPPVSWSVEQEGLTDVSLLGAWGDATSPLSIVVGQAGVIMESTGGDWRIVPSGTEETLVGIWGTGVDNVFAVGTGGVILRRTAAGQREAQLELLALEQGAGLLTRGSRGAQRPLDQGLLERARGLVHRRRGHRPLHQLIKQLRRYLRQHRGLRGRTMVITRVGP